MLADKLGGKPGWAATIIVLAGLLVIGGPTVMIGDSFANQLHRGYNKFESGQLTIPRTQRESCRMAAGGREGLQGLERRVRKFARTPRRRTSDIG